VLQGAAGAANVVATEDISCGQIRVPELFLYRVCCLSAWTCRLKEMVKRNGLLAVASKGGWDPTKLLHPNYLGKRYTTGVTVYIYYMYILLRYFCKIFHIAAYTDSSGF
jgi:hypothetical protein